MEKFKAAILPVSNILEKAIQRSRAGEQIKPYREMADEQLVASVQNGETMAFAHIVDRYEGKLFAYIMRLTNHRDEAHDITQEVFLKAYKNIHRFDTERKFSSWIYRIAHNESVNWLKKKTRAKVESLESHVDNGLQVPAKSDTVAQYLRREDQNTVRDAIDRLPEKYKRVMELRYLEEYSYEEISVFLEKPVNTVGTLINRAKKRLAEEIGPPPALE